MILVSTLQGHRHKIKTRRNKNDTFKINSRDIISFYHSRSANSHSLLSDILGRLIRQHKPWIKFDDFIALYNANPQKWDISRDTPRCATDARDYWGPTYVRFKLHYIGYCRYQLWKFMKNRQQAKERQRQEYEKALKVLGINMRQKDIIFAHGMYWMRLQVFCLIKLDATRYLMKLQKVECQQI